MNIFKKIVSFLGLPKPSKYRDAKNHDYITTTSSSRSGFRLDIDAYYSDPKNVKELEDIKEVLDKHIN